jgi:hypothetical protein
LGYLLAIFTSEDVAILKPGNLLGFVWDLYVDAPDYWVYYHKLTKKGIP